MTIHNTGQYSVAVFLQPEELEKEGQGIREPDDEWTRKLALSVMDDLGIHSRGKLEIEAFAGHGGLMVFAALRPEDQWETLFFSFDSLESVLTLAAGLNGPLPARSTLTYIGNRYILSISSPAQECTRFGYVAGEFGRRLYRPAAYARHLSEHGVTVSASTALQDLTKVI